MLKIYAIFFLVLVKLPAMFSQSTMMMIDQKDIVNQIYMLTQHCERYLSQVIHYYDQDCTVIDDTVVYDNNIMAMQDMQINIIQSVCYTMLAAEEAFTIDPSSYPQDNNN